MLRMISSNLSASNSACLSSSRTGISSSQTGHGFVTARLACIKPHQYHQRATSLESYSRLLILRITGGCEPDADGTSLLSGSLSDSITRFLPLGGTRSVSSSSKPGRQVEKGAPRGSGGRHRGGRRGAGCSGWSAQESPSSAAASAPVCRMDRVGGKWMEARRSDAKRPRSTTSAQVDRSRRPLRQFADVSPAVTLPASTCLCSGAHVHTLIMIKDRCYKYRGLTVALVSTAPKFELSWLIPRLMSMRCWPS